MSRVNNQDDQNDDNGHLILEDDRHPFGIHSDDRCCGRGEKKDQETKDRRDSNRTLNDIWDS